MPVDGEGGGSTTSSTSPCPAEVPEEGTSCPAGLSCPYHLCSTIGQLDKVAICDGGQWTVAVAMECPGACSTLGACACFDRPDCQLLSEDCFCICDFQCPGHAPCDCECGGGAYLGCHPL